MKLGLFNLCVRLGQDPASLAATARAAESAGFESMWVGEHIVLPDPAAPESLMEPWWPLHDPLIALAHVAAYTTSLRIGTSVVLLAQHEPVLLAKQVASLDVLSGGRMSLGIGAGYSEAEFGATGSNFVERGAVMDESIEVLRRLWYDEKPEFSGRFHTVRGVDAYPRPVQRPVPLLVGGRSTPALRRAVQRGNGWIGPAMTTDDVKSVMAELRRVADQVDRPVGLGQLEITVSAPGRLTPQLVSDYAALGVDRLIVYPHPTDDGIEATLSGACAAVEGGARR